MSWLKRLIGLQPSDPLPYVQHGRQQQPHKLRIQYLGTAGFVVSDPHRTIVLDPYVSRPNVRQSLFERLQPDAELIQRHIPHANDVLIGHAHHDHILDGPALCRQTGARLIGSSATRQVGLAAGLPESQIVTTSGHEDIASGRWQIRAFPSRHGKLLGRIPFPGDMVTPPPWPPRMHELKHGLVLNWLVDTGSLKVMHIDSADFIAEELHGQHCDVLCLCAVGRRARANYTSEIISILKPRWVIPCHWDTMFTPIDAEPDLIPGVDLLGFLDEIRSANAQPLLTPLRGSQFFS